MPIDLEQTCAELNKLDRLFAHPAAPNKTVMDAVFAFGLAARIPFVLPAIGIGVDEVNPDEGGEVLLRADLEFHTRHHMLQRRQRHCV